MILSKFLDFLFSGVVPDVNIVPVNISYEKVHIQLFQERLSFKGVKAYATMPNGYGLPLLD